MVKSATAIALTAFGLLVSSPARADVLPFSWSTSGSFSPSSYLSFTGVAAGAPVNTDAAGNLSNINLGVITFQDVPAAGGFSGTFNLDINFVSPQGASDPALLAPFTLSANVSGGNDNLFINFPNSSLLTFNGVDGTGTFTFGLPDFNRNRTGSGNTRTFALVGNISGAALTRSAAAVPEPSSVLLLCTMVGAIGVAARRKLQSR